MVAKKDQKLFSAIERKVGKDLDVIDGDRLLKEFESGSRKSKETGSSSNSKSDQKTAKQNNSKEPGKEIVPDFTKTKTVKMSKDDTGKILIEVLNKPEKKEEKKAEPKQGKAPAKQQPAPKKKTKPAEKKKPAKKSKKKEIVPPKPKIELKTIDKAVERNKNTHKPAKGIWGLIKSMLPKF